jgi:hypothetical protein
MEEGKRRRRRGMGGGEGKRRGEKKEGRIGQ